MVGRRPGSWAITWSAPGVVSLSGPATISLGDPPVVVAEQGGGAGDDVDGAAVVHVQGVLGGTGEQRGRSR